MNKILVVDDTKLITQIFDKFLSREGYKVITAETTPKALSIIRSQEKIESRIDLIIVDLKLQDLSGVDVIIEGRKKNIPSIAITAGVGIDEYIEPLRALGYTRRDIFFKPIDLPKILAKIKQTIG